MINDLNKKMLPIIMKKLLTTLILTLFLTVSVFVVGGFVNTADAALLDDFIITVQSDNTGTSASTEFTIPTTGAGYNYNVDCDNDGIDEATAQAGDYTCDYTTSSLAPGAGGPYTIRIEDNSGAGTGFPRIYFNDGGDKYKILSIDQWGTGAWTNMNSAFSGTRNLLMNATDAPAPGFTDMTSMFLSSMKFGDGSGTWLWDTSTVTNMTSLFNGTLFDGDISTWDVSNVELMSLMFRTTSIFNQDISSWDTSSVESMFFMFYDSSLFNQDIGNWDTRNVTNTRFMFYNADSFNQDIGNWETSSLLDARDMFNSNDLFNQDISTKAGLGNQGGNAWDISTVTLMHGMFHNVTVFNQDIGNWDTRNVTDMSSMFENADSFNQDIGNWETTSLLDARDMFKDNDLFNQDISTKAGLGNQGGNAWDTSSVANMNSTFFRATNFLQNLATWDMTSVTDAADMFENVTLGVENVDAMLIAWDAQALQSGVPLDMGISGYCYSTADRQNMIDTDTWVITDGGQDCTPVVTITAPTKLNNGSITDTTIQVTDFLGVLATNVSIDAATTAVTSSLSCTQTTATQVDCTISVDSSGDLTITATNSTANSSATAEANYIVDTYTPVSTVSVDTVTNSVDDPIITFSATDNVAVDHFEITYNLDNNITGIGGSVTDNPVTSPVTLDLDPDETLHSVTLRTYDTAGNFLDTIAIFPPVITFNAPVTIKNSTISDTTFTVTTSTGNDVTNIAFSAGTTTATLGTCTGNNLGTSDPWQQPVICAIDNITATGTVAVDAEDVETGATGQNNLSYIIETTDPVAVITAPLKADNAAITTTTIKITDDTAILVADVSISAVNTTGTFSVSTLSCTQTTALQVDCTLQIDANEGTGDLRVTYQDVATNATTTDLTSYEIDLTAPAKPAAIDLATASDSAGLSTTDNITTDTTPDFNVVCTEVGNTIMVYLDATLEEVHTCVAIATETVNISTAQADATYAVTYSETDIYGNASAQSTALSLVIDTVAPAVTATNSISDDTGSSSIDEVTSDQTLTITGTAEANAIVEVYIDAGSIGTVLADALGDWTFDHTGTTLAGGATYSITSEATDAAGNTGALSPALSVTIDVINPGTPAAAPDLQAASDLGISNTDDLTSDKTPSFDVVCSEASSTITLYSDSPAANTVIGTHSCAGAGTVTVTTSALGDAVHNITYSETDLAGNGSLASASIAITIDGIATSTINTPSNGSPISGTADTGDNVVISTPSGATCTTTAVANAWSCTLTPSPVDGENVTVNTSDIAGNTANATNIAGIDTSAPVTPTIDTVAAGDATITGTGDIASTVTLGTTICGNAPVIVDGLGVWSCIGASPAPLAGSTLTATTTDTGGNIAIGTYDIPSVSVSTSLPGGGRRRSAKEVAEIFGTDDITTETEISDSSILREGELCPASQIITQNLKAGAHNGFSVIEVKILQAHMNRLGFSSGAEDGIIGSITDGAIKRMQEYLGTFQDGYIGPITRGLINHSCEESFSSATIGDALESDLVAALTSNILALQLKQVEVTTPQGKATCYINYTRLIKLGLTGEDVRQVQVCMNSLGYTTGIVDGIYGSDTYAGVTEYQIAQGLQYIDGIVGPETSRDLNA
jgi:surface protein